MTDQAAEPPTRTAIKACAEWLAYCLKIGWCKDQLDQLEALWWRYHDERHPHPPAAVEADWADYEARRLTVAVRVTTNSELVFRKQLNEAIAAALREAEQRGRILEREEIADWLDSFGSEKPGCRYLAVGVRQRGEKQ